MTTQAPIDTLKKATDIFITYIEMMVKNWKSSGIITKKDTGKKYQVDVKEIFEKHQK
jgi:uncharacterized iron-regulated protein